MPVEPMKKAHGFANTSVPNAIISAYVYDHQTLLTLCNQFGSALNAKAIVVMPIFAV